MVKIKPLVLDLDNGNDKLIWEMGIGGNMKPYYCTRGNFERRGTFLHDQNGRVVGLCAH